MSEYRRNRDQSSNQGINSPELWGLIKDIWKAGNKLYEFFTGKTLESTLYEVSEEEYKKSKENYIFLRSVLTDQNIERLRNILREGDRYTQQKVREVINYALNACNKFLIDSTIYRASRVYSKIAEWERDPRLREMAHRLKEEVKVTLYNLFKSYENPSIENLREALNSLNRLIEILKFYKERDDVREIIKEVTEFGEEVGDALSFREKLKKHLKSFLIVIPTLFGLLFFLHLVDFSTGGMFLRQPVGSISYLLTLSSLLVALLLLLFRRNKM